MSVMNLGRVKGNSWYIGDLITGESTTPTAFPASGVSYAIIGDVYLNVTGDDRGHVYQCDTAGDPDDALWVFVGSILGPMPEVVNNLESSSTTKALSAAMGKKLNDLLDTYGLQPYVVTPTSGAVAYTAAVVIEDKDTTFTVTDIEGNTGTYSHTEAGGTQATVNITIGTSIGLPDNGAVIKSIKSSGAKIFSYKLYNSTSTEIFSETPSLWDHITNDELNIVPYSDITEGANTYKSGLISKIISGIRTTLYPVTHAKAVFFDKANNQNVYDRIVADETSLGKAVANTPWYGSCSTAAATAAKVATTADTMIGTLAAGMKVSILFEHENTAADPTLNVDGKGAIPIVAFGTTAPTVSWKDGEVVNFIYDGTSWIMGATAGQVEKITSDLSELFDFSTSEVNTHQKWIDGKDIYRKVLEVAAFPNNTTISVPTGTSNLSDVITIRGMYIDSADNYIQGNWTDSAPHRVRYMFRKNSNSIDVWANADYHDVHGFIIIEYTKTTV